MQLILCLSLVERLAARPWWNKILNVGTDGVPIIQTKLFTWFTFLWLSISRFYPYASGLIYWLCIKHIASRPMRQLWNTKTKTNKKITRILHKLWYKQEKNNKIFYIFSWIYFINEHIRYVSYCDKLLARRACIATSSRHPMNKYTVPKQ